MNDTIPAGAITVTPAGVSEIETAPSADCSTTCPGLVRVSGTSETPMPAVAVSNVIAPSSGASSCACLAMVPFVIGSPHQLPHQIGRSGSPFSNSIQTLALIGGCAHIPMSMNANGTQGVAQFISEIPGTLTCSLPSPVGSTLDITVPRYFPK